MDAKILAASSGHFLLLGMAVVPRDSSSPLPRLNIVECSHEVLDRKIPAFNGDDCCKSFSIRGLWSSSFVKVGSAML